MNIEQAIKDFEKEVQEKRQAIIDYAKWEVFQFCEKYNLVFSSGMGGFSFGFNNNYYDQRFIDILEMHDILRYKKDFEEIVGNSDLVGEEEVEAVFILGEIAKMQEKLILEVGGWGIGESICEDYKFNFDSKTQKWIHQK